MNQNGSHIRCPGLADRLQHRTASGHTAVAGRSVDSGAERPGPDVTVIAMTRDDVE